MWADVVLLILLVGVTYAGYKRGLINELTDWAVIILGGTIAMRLCRPLGNALHGGPFAGWTESATYKLAFWIVFFPLFLGILSLGLHLDRVSKEQERIPEQMRAYPGLILAFVKAMTLASLFVTWVATSGTLTPTETREFHKSPMVNFVRAANPLVMGLVYVACPSDMAARFDKMMRAR